MSDIDIKAMVDRFLSWELPEDFEPDGGISYIPRSRWRLPEDGDRHTPRHIPTTGTNLFTAVQAEAMIRHMLGAEQPNAPQEPIEECPTCHLTPADAEKVDVYCGDPWHRAHPTAGKLVAIRGKHLELSENRWAGIGIAEAPHDDGLFLMFCNPANAKPERFVKVSYEAMAALVELLVTPEIADKVDIGFKRLRDFQIASTDGAIATGQIEETDTHEAR